MIWLFFGFASLEKSHLFKISNYIADFPVKSKKALTLSHTTEETFAKPSYVTLLSRSKQSECFSVKTLYTFMNTWWSCRMCRFRARPRRPPTSNFSSFIISKAVSRMSYNIQMQVSTCTQLIILLTSKPQFFFYFLLTAPLLQS